jgi:hypothetical protein
MWFYEISLDSRLGWVDVGGDLLDFMKKCGKLQEKGVCPTSLAERSWST